MRKRKKEENILAYVPPAWCKFTVFEHYDGIGGCWGVSYGYVAQQGYKYCEKCDCYNKDYFPKEFLDAQENLERLQL